MKRWAIVAIAFIALPACRPRIETLPAFSFPVEKKAVYRIEGKPFAFTCERIVTREGRILNLEGEEIAQLPAPPRSSLYLPEGLLLETAKGTFLLREGKLVERKAGIQVRGKEVIRKAHGKTVWKKAFPSELSPPLLYKGRIYLGSRDRWVYALRVKDGKVLWKMRVGGAVVAAPAAFKDKVCFAALDANLYCFHYRKGHMLWVKRLPGRGYYPPLVADSLLIAPSFSRKIVAFKKDGKRLSPYEIPFELSFPLCYSSGRLYLAYYNYRKGITEIEVLTKKLAVEIKLDPKPPLFLGDAITVEVRVVGLREPEVSFEVDGKVLQKGDSQRLIWVPEKEGEHVLGVKASKGELTLKKELRLRVYSRESYWKEVCESWRKRCYRNRF